MIVRGETIIHNGVVEVVCNRCGNSCRNHFSDGSDAGFEFATLHAKWGFGSKRDLEEHEAHICEKCYNEILPELEKLGLKIQVTDYAPLG